MTDCYQLLILGNGFDLHCGLKSSYKDFFNNSILDTTVKSFGIKRMKISDAGFWENLLFEYYKISGDMDYNWCDIEEIIKSNLLLIYYGEDTTKTDLRNGLFYRALDFIKNNGDIRNEQMCSDTPIKKYLFTYCVQFFNNIEFREKLHYELLPLLSQNLLENLNKLENRFCKYLRDNIVNPNNKREINNNYIISAVNLLSAITGFSTYTFHHINDIINNGLSDVYINTEHGPQHLVKKTNFLSGYFPALTNTYILNFNYTNLFDILEVQCPCNFDNVHGKLCNQACRIPCESSNIIFGIDDTLIHSHNTNSDLRLFSKTYRKMCNKNTPTNILPANDNPSTSVIIKFYGHSLSEADYSYFQSIFDYYNLYGNNKISLIFYYSKGYEQNDEIYQLINTYGKTLSNQDQGKNLMHKLLLENRLKILEIP